MTDSRALRSAIGSEREKSRIGSTDRTLAGGASAEGTRGSEFMRQILE
jgi:hypothetical protein